MMDRRRFADLCFAVLTGACACTAVGIFGLIAWAILSRGLPALSWGYLTSAEDGLLHPLFGTLILIATALAVCLPLATAIALVRTFYWPRARRVIELMLYGANGLPSIVFGIFGLIVFVQGMGLGKSWLVGGLLLGFMILPATTVALIESLDRIPVKYFEAAAGLGLRRAKVIWSVALPQARAGLVSGSLLGLARAAGETAPIMFTAVVFSGAGLPAGIRESPVLALPYHIFVLAQDSLDPAAGEQLWGAATVLLVLVTGLALAAMPLRLKTHEEAEHG